MRQMACLGPPAWGTAFLTQTVNWRGSRPPYSPGPPPFQTTSDCQHPTFDGDDSVSGWAKAAVGRIQQSGVMMDTGDNMFPPLQKNRPTPESSPSPPSYDCTVWPLLFPNDSPAQSPLSMGRAKILPVSPIGSRRRTGPFSPAGTALTNPWK